VGFSGESGDGFASLLQPWSGAGRTVEGGKAGAKRRRSPGTHVYRTSGLAVRPGAESRTGKGKSQNEEKERLQRREVKELRRMGPRYGAAHDNT